MSHSFRFRLEPFGALCTISDVHISHSLAIGILIRTNCSGIAFCKIYFLGKSLVHRNDLHTTLTHQTLTCMRHLGAEFSFMFEIIEKSLKLIFVLNFSQSLLFLTIEIATGSTFGLLQDNSILNICLKSPIVLISRKKKHSKKLSTNDR